MRADQADSCSTRAAGAAQPRVTGGVRALGRPPRPANALSDSVVPAAPHTQHTTPGPPPGAASHHKSPRTQPWPGTGMEPAPAAAGPPDRPGAPGTPVRHRRSFSLPPPATSHLPRPKDPGLARAPRRPGGPVSAQTRLRPRTTAGAKLLRKGRERLLTRPGKGQEAGRVAGGGRKKGALPSRKANGKAAKPPVRTRRAAGAVRGSSPYSPSLPPMGRIIGKPRTACPAGLFACLLTQKLRTASSPPITANGHQPREPRGRRRRRQNCGHSQLDAPARQPTDTAGGKGGCDALPASADKLRPQPARPLPPTHRYARGRRLRRSACFRRQIAAIASSPPIANPPPRLGKAAATPCLLPQTNCGHSQLAPCRQPPAKPGEGGCGVLPASQTNCGHSHQLAPLPPTYRNGRGRRRSLGAPRPPDRDRHGAAASPRASRSQPLARTSLAPAGLAARPFTHHHRKQVLLLLMSHRAEGSEEQAEEEWGGPHTP
ncbi:nascent polypeptide-associated complex subunit alpha, muscle-specific form-like [Penaeus indicus]|uniref:nascent polypeptide-associated complex subunit alpha, muscle-specific form-like n=1 Tax=Penaeus indicus TaxID=29960 RepID=UPI00300CA176